MTNKKLLNHRSIIAFLLSLLLAVLGVFPLSITALASDTFNPPSSVSIFGGSQYDAFNDVRITPDGGYIAVGYAYSYDGDMRDIKISGGKDDAIIVKYNADGSIQWKKVYGDTGPDYFCGIEVAGDGYIAVGRVGSGNNDNNFKAVIVKYDLDGNSVWTKNYQSSSYDGFESICATSDGGYIVAGRTDANDGFFSGLNRSGVLMKFDADWSLQWKTSTSLSTLVELKSVKQTQSGEYIVAGHTMSPSRYVFAKFDAQGNQKWVKMGAANGSHSAYDVIETSDGHIVGVGTLLNVTYSGEFSGYTPGGSNDAFIMKFTQSGSLVWSKTLSANDQDIFTGIFALNDGGFLVTARSDSTNLLMDGKGYGGHDVVVIKCDSDGNIIASVIYGGSGQDKSNSIDVDSNKIVIAGETTSKNYDIPLNKGSYDGFVLVISLTDKATLDELIATVQAANENDYIPASWAPFAAALSSAIAVDADPDATAAEIDAAIAGLQAAYNALVPRPDKTSLAIAINQAAGLNKAYYTNASWNSMLGGLNTAYSVYDNPNASQAEVDDAYNQLAAAIDALKPSLNKEALGLTIKSALSLNSGDYTPDSWSQMVSKLQIAAAIYNELPGGQVDYQPGMAAPENISQETIDGSNAELLNAIASLEGNKKAIINAITEQAQDIDNSQFTTDTWVLFTNVLSNAAAASSDPDVTDEEISQYLAQLLAAMGGIESAVSLADFPDTYIIDDNNDKAYIYGTVSASILSAEVTLSGYFHIAPNAPEGERFISPDIGILNTSTMPISVTAVSFKATGEAPRVVSSDTYSDAEWSQLGLADTKTSIAMGYTGVPTGDFFFAAEEQQTERLLGTLDAQQAMSLGLQAKFGLSWDKPQNFKYESVFSLGLIE